MRKDNRRDNVMRLAIEHRSQIWAFLMGLMKDPVRVEDLLQNTYVVICEKWQEYRVGTNFLAWALRIARYEFLISVDPARHPMIRIGCASQRPSGMGMDPLRPGDRWCAGYNTNERSIWPWSSLIWGMSDEIQMENPPAGRGLRCPGPDRHVQPRPHVIHDRQ